MNSGRLKKKTRLLLHFLLLHTESIACSPHISEKKVRHLSGALSLSIALGAQINYSHRNMCFHAPLATLPVRVYSRQENKNIFLGCSFAKACGLFAAFLC
ncbi:hypothetical protein CHARACLAT_004828 [Characodon lateralis]|uniref:Secreted protein n=1 Tax=Characodon lateralis TaxID=208331 RepID=A0ABU7EQY5_9TELE|nr:hypothetical protein [Characodon lateralis]